MPCKKAAKSAFLIPQALRQGRRRHLSQPRMPCCALPLRQPPRKIDDCEAESTAAVCFRANLERCIPQPPRRAEPAVKEPALRAIGVSAPSIAPRDEALALNITSEHSRIAAQMSTFVAGGRARDVSNRVAQGLKSAESLSSLRPPMCQMRKCARPQVSSRLQEPTSVATTKPAASGRQPMRHMSVKETDRPTAVMPQVRNRSEAV